jgi:hypothetical protein
MAGLDPAIHAFPTAWIDANEGVDHRVEPGDDDQRWKQSGIRGLLLLVGVEHRGDALGIGGERWDAGALDLQ